MQSSKKLILIGYNSYLGKRYIKPAYAFRPCIEYYIFNILEYVWLDAHWSGRKALRHKKNLSFLVQIHVLGIVFL